MQIAFSTLGCKVNQFDTNMMEHLVKGKNHTVVPFDQWADVYVINTCSVTQKSNYQSRQLIRRALRQNSGARVIVTGCYAETHPEEILEMPGVDLVLGNAHKPQLLERMEECGQTRLQGRLINGFGKIPALQQPSIDGCEGRSRIFLKVQDGCNFRCSFCIIPTARGPSRSLPAGEVVEQINRLTERGYREIVLTGVYLGAYGKDLSPRTSLSDLVQKISEETDLTRLRLSSLDPRDFNPDLLRTLVESPILCPHLHIPIQSGDDWILQKMRRGYTAAHVGNLLTDLTERIPDLWIGTDVMVGFPGERDPQFQRTRSFLESFPVTSIHVFPYSSRPGTPAALMRGQVSPTQKQKRSKILRDLSRRKEEDFKKKFLGRTFSVILLEKEGGHPIGITENYLKIRLAPFESEGRSSNNLVDAEITAWKDGELMGRKI